MDWFRSWHGAPTDTKWLAVARSINEKRTRDARDKLCVTFVTAVTWALMDHASQANPRGSVQDFDVEGYACWASVPDANVRDVIAGLTDKNVIKDNEFVNWVKRQSSDGAERMRKLRERRKDENVTDVTERASHVLREDKNKVSIERGISPVGDHSPAPKRARAPSPPGTRFEDYLVVETPAKVHQALLLLAKEHSGMSPQAAANEFEVFRDHWRSQPGAKGVKSDWAATWRNWLRRAAGFRGGGSASPPRQTGWSAIL